MKKIYLFLLFIFSAVYLSAQEQETDNIQTFFHSKPEKIRGYAGPLSNTTFLDGKIAYMNGFNAAGIFNDHFILGFYSLNLENNIFSNNSTYLGYQMDFSHKGLWLGYNFMPKRIIHFNANLQLGKGDLEIHDDVLNKWLEDDYLFVVTPSLEVEFNVVKFLRIGIGANYRITLGVNQFDNYNNDDFSDFGAFISFKFGWFN